MDILRKELNQIYRKQGLENEKLDEQMVQLCLDKVKALADLTGMCCVMTDVSADRSYFVAGRSGQVLGLSDEEKLIKEIASSDEDFLYERIMPSELVDLRMLELRLHEMADRASVTEKLALKAYGTIWMRGRNGEDITVSKTTQILQLSPNGKIWLNLCCWDLSTAPHPRMGINPLIINSITGHISFLNFEEKRERILSEREKEILLLIRDGLLSKEIAGRLGISTNTVNRHRQNILEKLSVDNSMEAVNAALAFRLIG